MLLNMEDRVFIHPITSLKQVLQVKQSYILHKESKFSDNMNLKYDSL
jgi:hypothetical protein